MVAGRCSAGLVGVGQCGDQQSCSTSLFSFDRLASRSKNHALTVLYGATTPPISGNPYTGFLGATRGALVLCGLICSRIPNPLCLLVNRWVMDFSKVPPTPTECCNDSGRRILFQHWHGQPLAGSYVNQIDRRSGFIGVIEVRPGDAAQPEPPVGVTGPHKRGFVEVGESGDPTDTAAADGPLDDRWLLCGAGSAPRS